MIRHLVSTGPWISCLLALLAVVFYYTVLEAYLNHRVRKLGGVRSCIIAANPLTAFPVFFDAAVKQAQNRLLDFSDGLYRLATPDCPNCVELSISGRMRFLFTREPDHVKTILTSMFSDFGKGKRFHQTLSPFLGNGIFTTDGKLWSDSRRLIRPMFIKEKLRDIEIFERWTQALMSKIPASGQTVNIMNLFYRMTLDLTTDFLLDTSVNSLQEPFGRILLNRYKRGIRVLEKFIGPYIYQALAIPPSDLEKPYKSDKSTTFLHRIARYSRDPKFLRDQIFAILLAGRDTTAATLSWAIYELAHYPAIYAKLRSEILLTVGVSRPPTYEDLKNMTYLRYTLNETLRLYPVVPYNLPTALEDTSLPGLPGQPDIVCLKDDVVMYSTLSMQRRKDLYPPVSEAFADPAVFSPDRWEHWTPEAWTYIPFSGGPRVCVGQNFAMTEMAFCLVRLLQKYEAVEYRGDWSAQYHKAEIVGCPGDEVRIAFREAQCGDVA